MKLPFKEHQKGNFLSLHIEIDDYEINIKMFPFVNKTILWRNVKYAEIIECKPFSYGIKMFSKQGTIYNVSGYYGLALQLKNGKKLMFGTKKENDLKQIIQQQGVKPK